MVWQSPITFLWHVGCDGHHEASWRPKHICIAQLKWLLRPLELKNGKFIANFLLFNPAPTDGFQFPKVFYSWFVHDILIARNIGALEMYNISTYLAPAGRR